MVLGQYRAVLVSTWWYCVSMERYCLINDGNGSAEGGTCWYLVVLGQYRAVQFDMMLLCHWLPKVPFFLKMAIVVNLEAPFFI